MNDPEYYDHDRDDFRREKMMRNHRIARLACTDRTCGARDCVTCRGDEALAEIDSEEEE